MTPVLPNVGKLIINHIKGLNALTLATWFLLAPNIRTLIIEVERISKSATIQGPWYEELNKALQTNDNHLKTIFKRIQKIKFRYQSDDHYLDYWLDEIEPFIIDIFPETVIE